MNDKGMTNILGRCLEEIAAGETPAACLARYPEHAAELAPLLAMAGELGTLGQYQVSDAARVRAKAQLRRAASAQRDQRSAPQGWLRPGSYLMPRVAAGLAFTLICVLLMAGIVAASGPGDLAYGLRIAAERIPARLSPNPETRARAELGIASRRLADLDRTMRSQDQELDERTVSALLVSVEAAAEMATTLSEPVRAGVAARVADQAELLQQLKRLAHRAQEAGALEAASERAYRAAERAGGGPISPTPRPVEPLHEPTKRSSETPHGALTPARTPFPGSPATATASPTPAPSTSPSRATPGGAERQQATPQARPTATAGRNTPQATPLGPGPTATSRGPGPAATSPGPRPTATAPGPGPDPTSPGPGPVATSPGPDPAATSPGPGPTSPDPGPDSPPGHSPGPRG